LVPVARTTWLFTCCGCCRFCGRIDGMNGGLHRAESRGAAWLSRRHRRGG
jgi:hypothetical protein